MFEILMKACELSSLPRSRYEEQPGPFPLDDEVRAEHRRDLTSGARTPEVSDTRRQAQRRSQDIHRAGPSSRTEKIGPIAAGVALPQLPDEAIQPTVAD